MEKSKDYKREIENLKSSLMKCAENAENVGTCILTEPLGRYESNLINTLKEIKLQGRLVSSKNQFTIAQLKANGYLKHIHFGDSNTCAPGQGHIDFKQIIGALKKV